VLHRFEDRIRCACAELASDPKNDRRRAFVDMIETMVCEEKTKVVQTGAAAQLYTSCVRCCIDDSGRSAHRPSARKETISDTYGPRTDVHDAGRRAPSIFHSWPDWVLCRGLMGHGAPGIGQGHLYFGPQDRTHFAWMEHHR